MAKVLKIVGVVASIAAAVVTAGVSLGVTAGLLSAVALGASVGASLLSPRPKTSTSRENIDRLRATIDPRTPRKTVVGKTAMATDIRDEEFTDNQTYLHRFIVVASHKVHAIREIWFDDKKAWDSTSGVVGDFVGYLTVTPILEGNAGNAINISARMGSTRRYTGLAYVRLRYKLTGNTSKVDSPFAQQITTRITIRGDGAYFYDPRLDSTVAGGSGSHRANDQSTWGWSDDYCRNPALALLFYLLGWEINGKLAVGKGIPADRIDLESFAVAANICDESVTKIGGGTEPRYRTDGVWSEGDSPTTVIDMLKASMNADLDDVDGKLRLTVFHNDLADVAADFGASDILGDFEWVPQPPLDQTFNVVRGVYTDPSDISLYQPVDYPEQREDSPDGIDRIETFDQPMVQSAGQAQRLAQLRLQRQKFGGTFSAEFQSTAWKVEKNSIIRLTFPPAGFVNKLFRVAEMEHRVDGVVPMVLREENAAIYGAPSLSAPVDPVAASNYSPTNDPIIAGINASPTLDGVAPVTLYADYLGAFLTDQLPFNFNVVRRAGGVDVSASTTWSIITQTGITGAAVTISSAGVVTIPSGITMSAGGTILIRSVRDGVTLETSVSVTKVNGIPPSTGGSGGGTTVSDSTLGAVSTTSFADISDVMTVRTGSSGQIQFSAPLTVTATQAAPELEGSEGEVEIKWQYRTVGGSWTDAASAVASNPDVLVFYVDELGKFFDAPGAVTSSPVKTGLSASTDYEVKLIARRTSSTPAKSISFIGTVSAVGS